MFFKYITLHFYIGSLSCRNQYLFYRKYQYFLSAMTIPLKFVRIHMNVHKLTISAIMTKEYCNGRGHELQTVLTLCFIS